VDKDLVDSLVGDSPEAKTPSAPEDEVIVTYRANGVDQKVKIGELKKKAASSDGAEKARQEMAEIRKLVLSAVNEGNVEAEMKLYDLAGVSPSKIAEIQRYREEIMNQANPDDPDEIEETSETTSADPDNVPVSRGELAEFRSQQARQEADRIFERAEMDIENLIDSDPRLAKIKTKYGENTKGFDKFKRMWAQNATVAFGDQVKERLGRGQRWSNKWAPELVKGAVEKELGPLVELTAIGNATHLGRVPDTSGLLSDEIPKTPKEPKPGASEQEWEEFIKDDLIAALRAKNGGGGNF